MKRALLLLAVLAACGPADEPPAPAPPLIAGIGEDSLTQLRTEQPVPLPPLSLEPFYSSDGVLDSIRVLRGGRAEQTLAGEGDTEPAYTPGSDVDTVDINLDGNTDISQVTIRGATGNVLYRWWLFDPDSGRFVHSPEFSREIGAYTLDRRDRRIVTRSNGGHAGAIFSEVTYEPRGRALVRVRSISQDFDPETERYLRTTGRLQGQQWVERVDTFTVETLPSPDSAGTEP